MDVIWRRVRVQWAYLAVVSVDQVEFNSAPCATECLNVRWVPGMAVDSVVARLILLDEIVGT